MGRTSAELKRLSREQLNGHWGFAIGVNLLSQIIISAVLMPFYLLFLFTGQRMVQFAAYMLAVVILCVISVVMQCGIVRIYLSFARKQQASIGMMFGEFTKRPDRYIFGFMIIFGIEFLCMLPGTICLSVGIISGLMLAHVIGMVLSLGGLALAFVVTFHLALVFFLLVDHGDMGIMDALKESGTLMRGRKGKLFYIYLSFLGWSLLGMLSCGIGTLWVMPYMMQTNVNFYLDVIGELDQKPEFVFS